MKLRIFLADDRGIVREGMRCLLEKQKDLQVVGEADNGWMAVDQVRQLQPDVVILGATIPGLDSLEATRRILETCPHTQVIILSVNTPDSEQIFLALQAGARGYLGDESVGMELIRAIRCVSAGQRYLGSRAQALLTEDYLQLKQSYALQSPLAQLSVREREVLQLVATGKSSREIASALFLSPKTVDTYRSRLMKKMGFKNLSDLITFALQAGLVPPDAAQG